MVVRAHEVFNDLSAPSVARLQQVTPNLFAMILVVAFSSCLDVAAIEMEMGTPLDFNGELQTVRGGVFVVVGAVDCLFGCCLGGPLFVVSRKGIALFVSRRVVCFKPLLNQLPIELPA